MGFTIGCALAGSANGGTWPTFGNGPAHTGFYPLTVGDVPAVEVWTKSIMGPLSQVAVADGRVFVTSSYGLATGDSAVAIALDAATGDELWRYLVAPYSALSGPTVSNEAVLFTLNSSEASAVYVLDAKSGNFVRRIPFATQGGTPYGPTVSGDSVWIRGSYFGGLEGFNLTDGSKRFEVTLDQADDWTPTYDGKALYACIDGVCTAHNPETGARLWTLDMRTAYNFLAFAAQPVVANNRAFFISFGRTDVDTGNSVLLAAVDVLSGTLLWRAPQADYYPGGAPLPSGFSGIPATDGDTVYAISTTAVHAFDAATGRPGRVYETGWTLSGQPLVTNDLVFTSSPSGSGQTYVFDKASGSLKYTLSGAGDLSFAEGVLYIAERGGYSAYYNNWQPGKVRAIRFSAGQSPPPAPLRNLSTRLLIRTGGKAAIAGFIITGTAPKKVLLRGLGPSMQQSGVSDVLADPTLELHDWKNIIAQNDNWQTTQIGGAITADQRSEFASTTLAPTDPHESALIASLWPGNYSVVDRGVNGTTGTGLVEVYDLDPTSGSKLANISTRGYIDNGDIMIAGFVVGFAETRLIFRAVPALPPGPETGLGLADTTLELFNANGASLAFNDNWEDTQKTEIQSFNMAPFFQTNSAIISSLAPGSYTVILRQVRGAVGGALVELYALP
jgi:hypothetical protein